MAFLDGLPRGSPAERKYQEALAFQRTGSYREAEAAYREVIRLDPSFFKAYTNLGSILLKDLKRQDPECDKRFLEAVEWYTRALEIRPDDALTLYNLGTIYYENFNDEEKAFDLFARAVNADPQSVHKIGQYLGRASYTTKQDLRNIMERSGQLALQKNVPALQQPGRIRIKDMLRICGCILLLVFIASFFMFPVCGMIAFRNNLAATILILLGIIGGIVGVVNAKTHADRILNLFLCLLFVVVYYRVVLGCWQP